MAAAPQIVKLAAPDHGWPRPLPLFAYTGQMWDAAAGLYYYHARWYDPHTGRFISQDPTGFHAGDPNLYRYVGNDAENFVDPTGLNWWDDITIMAKNPGATLGGAATGAGHGAAMVANAATAGLITPLDDHVNNLIEQNGGVYGAANMAANIAVAAATAALPCGALANAAKMVAKAAAVRDLAVAAQQRDIMAAFAALLQLMLLRSGRNCFVAGTQVVVGVDIEGLPADAASAPIDVALGTPLSDLSKVICVGIGVAGFIALQPANDESRRRRSGKGRPSKHRREFDELFDGEDFSGLDSDENGDENEGQARLCGDPALQSATMGIGRVATMDRPIVFEFTNAASSRFAALPFGEAGDGGSLDAASQTISRDRVTGADSSATGLAVAHADRVAECVPFPARLNPIVRSAERRGPRPTSGKLHLLRWGWLSACLFMAAVLGFGRSENRGREAILASATTQATAAAPRDRYLTKNIEDLEVGDKVLAWDEATGRQELRSIDRTYRRTTDHLRILKIRDSLGAEQTLQTTNEHPFWIFGRGWVNAGALADGDRLLQPGGETATLVDSALEPQAEGIPVFNLRVEGAHTYFASAANGFEPVLVHNANYPTNAYRKAGLPTRRGKYRFVPDKGATPPNRGPGGGYVDKFRNEWQKGPNHHFPGDPWPYEWDVQLTGGGYINVSGRGVVAN